MWSFFKHREVSYDIRLYLALFISPERSTVYNTNLVRFCGSLIWNKLIVLIKPSSQFLKMLIVNVRLENNTDV